MITHKRIVFKVESSRELGVGHLMRCLTLANELSIQQYQIYFICTKLEGNANYKVKEYGFKLYELTNNKELNINLDKTIAFLSKFNTKPDLLIIDNYEINYKWESEVKKYVYKVAVVDDLANRTHDCDILIDQNYYKNFERRYDHLVPNRCVKFLGPENAILRRGFLETPTINHQGDIRDLFVSFGGSDPTGETLEIVKVLKRMGPTQFHTHVVLGSANKEKLEILELCQDDTDFTVYVDVNNIEEIMSFCDIAIGAGGTMTWERAILGLPTIVISVAENQIQLSKDVDQFGALIYLGHHDQIDYNDLLKELKSLLNNRSAVKRMNEKSMKLVNQTRIKKNPLSKKVLNIIDS